MELKEAIKKRRSIRSFTNEEVKTAEIKEILQIASYAPSINNSQAWEFILIKNKILLQKMAESVKTVLNKIEKSDNQNSEQIMKKVEWYSTFFKDAPALITIIQKNYSTEIENAIKLSKSEINELRNYPDIQSAGALIQNILLTALDFGYGTCWLSSPSIAGTELETLLNVIEGKKVLAFVAIGKPLTTPQIPEIKNIDEVFTVIE